MDVNRTEIATAWDRIRPRIMQTPTVLAKIAGHEISFKFEHMQHTGSFKSRGAMNSILSMDIPAAGLVAASGGNHGAAVAWAAAQVGVNARIYVPEFAGPTKINLIKALGADLVVVPGEYANAMEHALSYEAETGAAQIHAYDAPATLNGQGSVMAEWEDQGLEADTVLIAVGGGGLIGGAMAWLDGSRRVVGVEPHTAQALNQALLHGPDTQVQVSGIAANALGARQVGRYCYDIAKTQGLSVALVDDDAIATAQRMIWDHLRQVVEPAGAAALAALVSGAYVPQEDERVAVLLCGSNGAKDPLA